MLRRGKVELDLFGRLDSPVVLKQHGKEDVRRFTLTSPASARVNSTQINADKTRESAKISVVRHSHDNLQVCGNRTSIPSPRLSRSLRSDPKLTPVITNGAN